MTIEIAIIFALLVGTVILFTTERVPVDIITLTALCVLTVTGILSPAEAFAGFSSDVIIMLGAIFILGGALQHTGVLHRVAGWLLKLAGNSETRLTGSLMLAAGAISGFMNNTTVAAVFVPPVSSLANRAGISASKLLMPLAFASIIGGTCTLIGTSTNIAVSGYIARAGMQPIGMFEVFPIGIVLLAAGILFMVTIGNRLLPSHENNAVSDAAGARNYLAEVTVLPSSPLIGDLASNCALTLVGFRLVNLIRESALVPFDEREAIASGDRLIIEGDVEKLRKISKIEGLAFVSNLVPDEIGVDGGDSLFVEAIVLPGGELTGATLGDVQFRQRYGLDVLAINRGGEPLRESIETLRLREADVLLLHGLAERVDPLRRPGSHLRLLGDGSEPEMNCDPRRGWSVLAIFFASVIAAGSGILPVSVAFLCGAVLVVLSGCIPADRAREFIDWRLLVLVGGMTAFGTAMEKTGAADLLASWVTGALAPLGATGVLAGFILLTVLLTQPMSNAAAALVVLPVALASAAEIGAEPRTFAIGIMLAASISFITPLEPACLLVFGAGKYRMFDFIKIGGLLTLFLAAIILFLLPKFWQLNQ
ncbi:MAG: di/tricarboxylate transporter [Verrucomicrobiales bacterium]|jgi:di/tricarboxylate transporter